MRYFKTIELWIRRHFNRHVGMQRIPIVVSHPQPVISSNDAARILLLRQDRIGDVLVSVPVIRALRSHFPTSTIDMVLSMNNISVRQAVAPYINDVILYKKGLIGLLKTRSDLRSVRYDVVVDLTDNASSTSAILIHATRARYAVGIDKENRGVYTHVVPMAERSSVHIVDRISRLLWPFDIDAIHLNMNLAFPLEAQHVQQAHNEVRVASKSSKILGVNISGSQLSRMYPENMLIEVMASCKDQNPEIEIVIMCAPQHREMQQRISTATGCRMIEPSPSFSAWAANINELDAFFTPDTSAVHLAAAFKKPCVVLYKHESADLLPWYPYNSPCFPVVTDGGQISTIPTQTVIEAIDQCLRSL